MNFRKIPLISGVLTGESYFYKMGNIKRRKEGTTNDESEQNKEK